MGLFYKIFGHNFVNSMEWFSFFGAIELEIARFVASEEISLEIILRYRENRKNFKVK